jgi:hypothetical protein
VLLDPETPVTRLRELLTHGNARAVFTTRDLVERVGRDRPIVVLDEAPMVATALTGQAEVTIDLGSHFGLSLVGEQDAPGRDEECVVFYDADATADARGTCVSHRDLLAALRQAARPSSDRHGASASTTPLTSIGSLAELTALLAPLLNGDSVRTAGS